VQTRPALAFYGKDFAETRPSVASPGTAYRMDDDHGTSLWPET